MILKAEELNFPKEHWLSYLNWILFYQNQAPLPKTYTVYRLVRNCGKFDKTTYIGYTNNWKRRVIEHRKTKKKFYKIVSLKKFTCKHCAIEFEKLAINKFKPEYNVLHNKGLKAIGSS